jgi:phosphoglycolate phosphatase-like HAD superfamily hydrolase
MDTTLSRAVFLDFDGVLFDTVREVYVVSMIALGRSVRTVDVDFDSAHFQKFSRYRYLVGPAWNYYYLVRSIEEKLACPETDLEGEFKKALGQWERGEHRPFEENFFQVRNRLRETDQDAWQLLMTPYRFANELRGLLEKRRESFFLVTTRDRGSVVHLLRLCHLKIPRGNIFAKEEYAEHNSKAEIIRDLMCDRQIEESIFVDDLKDHLNACESVRGLRPMQARWGYVAPGWAEDNSAEIIKAIEKFIHEKNVWA